MKVVAIITLEQAKEILKAVEEHPDEKLVLEVSEDPNIPVSWRFE